MNHRKNMSSSTFWNFLTMILIAATWAISFPSLAQDKKVEIDIGVNKEPVWYQQSWAWVIGAAIFILLLVALLRGGKKK